MLDELPASESGDLADTTIGLVGLGAIGRALAERLRSFGAHVVYASRTRQTTDVEERLGVSWLPLPDLLQASDIVSLHPPLTAETHRLIGEPELAMMPRGSFLVNTARRSCRRGSPAASDHVGPPGGVGLDVIDDELAGRNPFVDLTQVLVTLHLGGATRGSTTRTIERSAANVRRFLAGEVVRDFVPGLPLPSGAAGIGSSPENGRP